jgi:hypothetical protein
MKSSAPAWKAQAESTARARVRGWSTRGRKQSSKAMVASASPRVSVGCRSSRKGGRSAGSCAHFHHIWLRRLSESAHARPDSASLWTPGKKNTQPITSHARRTARPCARPRVGTRPAAAPRDPRIERQGVSRGARRDDHGQPEEVVIMEDGATELRDQEQVRRGAGDHHPARPRHEAHGAQHRRPPEDEQHELHRRRVDAEPRHEPAHAVRDRARRLGQGSPLGCRPDARAEQQHHGHRDAQDREIESRPLGREDGLGTCTQAFDPRELHVWLGT